MIYKDEILFYHNLSIEKYGGSKGIRDEGSLESAIDRLYASFDGEDLYTSPFQKAAAILESIVKNHPFVDGNKRTGFLAAAAMLLHSDYELTSSQDEAYNFVIEVASSQMNFETIVKWIEKHSIKI
jgi:death-on-curing protein